MVVGQVDAIRDLFNMDFGQRIAVLIALHAGNAPSQCTRHQWDEQVHVPATALGPSIARGQTAVTVVALIRMCVDTIGQPLID